MLMWSLTCKTEISPTLWSISISATLGAGRSCRRYFARSCTDSHLRCYCRQAHFLEKFVVSLVVAKASHQRIGFQFGSARVALSIGTTEPLECFVSLSAIFLDL